MEGQKQESPEMILFVKASNYSKSSENPRFVGECYLCHRVRMIVRLKGLIEKGICREVFVDPRFKNNHQLFKELDATMLPVLLHNGNEYDDAEEIEAHLENPSHNFLPFLESKDLEVNKLAQERSPISDFVKWVRASPKDGKKHGAKIAKFLSDVDNRLSQNAEGIALDGDDSYKLADCILLPKLYHMQVAAAFVCSERDPEPVDIFQKFTHLSDYMRKANQNQVFSETRPPIDEIQYKYASGKEKYERTKDESSMKQLTEL